MGVSHGVAVRTSSVPGRDCKPRRNQSPEMLDLRFVPRAAICLFEIVYTPRHTSHNDVVRCHSHPRRLGNQDRQNLSSSTTCTTWMPPSSAMERSINFLLPRKSARPESAASTSTSPEPEPYSVPSSPWLAARMANWFRFVSERSGRQLCSIMCSTPPDIPSFILAGRSLQTLTFLFPFASLFCTVTG
jgi:hypothetical protein